MCKMTKTEEFIEKAKKVHGDKYDYSKVEYLDCNTKVCIICPEHGEFWQSPRCHLRGRGCSLCSRNKKLTTETFIEKSREVYGDKYDYSKVEYVNNHTKVCIICPEHGEFWQKPQSHMDGHGCVKYYAKNCADRFSSTTEEFIEKAREVHDDRYDYSKVNYTNSYTKVCIICPKHGEFWQEPKWHLKGGGCPICKESKLEIEIRNFLIKNEIDFEEQKTFDWLLYKSKLYIDFYLPKYNVAIECQGRQHFNNNDDYFGGEKNIDEIINRDNSKYNQCKEHGIKIFYYSNLGINYPYEVFEDKNELLIKILKND